MCALVTGVQTCALPISCPRVSSAGGSAQSPLLAEMRVNLCRKRLTPDPAPAKGCPTESGHLHILSRGPYDTARTSARLRDPPACDGRRTGPVPRPSRDADGHGTVGRAACREIVG